MSFHDRGRARRNSVAALSVLIVFLAVIACQAARDTVNVTPDPVVDDSLSGAGDAVPHMAIFAGGCFWGLQLVFEHVKGVTKVTSGYSGGTTKNPSYEMVSSGQTGHAESVRIEYDPSQVTYGTLLKVFFSIAHDPTQLNRQGPDEGTQYRSIIFYADQDQQHVAQAYIDQMTRANVFKRKIVTQLVPFQPFYQAEFYHQDFAVHNPTNPYIAAFDLPKLENLRKSLPDLYVKH